MRELQSRTVPPASAMRELISRIVKTSSAMRDLRSRIVKPGLSMREPSSRTAESSFTLRELDSRIDEMIPATAKPPLGFAGTSHKGADSRFAAAKLPVVVAASRKSAAFWFVGMLSFSLWRWRTLMSIARTQKTHLKKPGEA